MYSGFIRAYGQHFSSEPHKEDPSLYKERLIMPRDCELWDPIEDNKFLLVSWRLGGSLFVRELLRENWPELTDASMWGKTHVIFENELEDLYNDLIDNDTKVFVVITDPREIALNLLHFDNGKHYRASEYNNAEKGSLEFLNAVLDKQMELVDWYDKKFKDNCIILRYEDALDDKERFFGQVTTFMDGLEPLGIDDHRKYTRSCYKQLGNFYRFFDKGILEEHYARNITFYRTFDYPERGLIEHKYGLHFIHSEPYEDLLERNGKGDIKNILRFTKYNKHVTRF